MTDDGIRCVCIFGHIELQSRMRWVSDTEAIGEGRKLEYDEHGKLINDSGWEPTGTRLLAG